MHVEPKPNNAAGLRIAIVVSAYHEQITGALRSGAEECFCAAGGSESDLLSVAAPGAFELTVLASHLAARDDIDAVVALGCVITGETEHDRYIAQAVSSGLTQVAASTGKPVSFGVLTCQSVAQARARAGGEHGNKGVEAMAAAIAAVHAIREIKAAAPAGGAR